MIRRTSVVLLAMLITFASIAVLSKRRNVSAQPTDTPVSSKFQPGVEDFLRNTFGNISATGVPDPNETLEVLQSYVSFRNSPNALENFRRLVEQNPASRFARLGLAQAYYSQYLTSRDREDAALALQEQLEAAKIAFSYGKVFYTSWIKQMALDAGQPEIAIEWFDQVLAQDPNNYDVTLNYGQLLVSIDSNARAEQFLRKAMKVRSTGNLDAHVAYAEFLLNNGRYQDVLSDTVLVGERAFYLDFLHGYALERLGRGSETVRYYDRYADMSRDFPAPRLFQIPESQFQRNITFAEDVPALDSTSLKESKSELYVAFNQDFSQQLLARATPAPATTNLSWVTACEAGPTETIGAQRMVAWSVRQRKNRGTIPDCLDADNSGNSDNEKYANVICQLNQYEEVICESNTNVTHCNNVNTKTDTSDQVAHDVYNGYVPDPFNNWCPSGSVSSNNGCTAVCLGGTASRGAFLQATPHSFLAYVHTPDPCMIYVGNVCGNGGGNENYFSYSP